MAQVTRLAAENGGAGAHALPAREASPFRLMAHVMSEQLAALSRTLRPLGINGPMYRLMTGLSEAGEASVADLAEHAGFERSYVSRLLDQLTRRGLVERVEQAVDRRQRVVRLTGAGRDLQRRAAVVVRRLLATHLGALSATEILQLSGLLKRISDTYRQNPAG